MSNIASRVKKFLSWFLLGVSLLCIAVSFLPIRKGVRLPVFVETEKMHYIDDEGNVALCGPWLRAGEFTKDDEAVILYAREKPGKICRDGTTKPFDEPIIQYSLIHPDHLPLGPDEREMILIRWPEKFHWVFKDQSEAIPGEWEGAHPFHGDQPAAVCKNGYWGFINRKGEEVLPYIWDDARSFDAGGLACVCRDGRWGIIDMTGKQIVRPSYRGMTGFDTAGYCAVNADSGAGFIDRSGKIIIPLRYQSVSPFDKEGLARCKMNVDWNTNRVGWIDRSGATVIPFNYGSSSESWFHSFEKHPTLFPIHDGQQSGLIDKKGQWIVPLGNGGLCIVRDSIAPGKEWYARVPEYNYKSNGLPELYITPGCYDEKGRQIWSGSTFYWRKLCRNVGIVLLFLSGLVFMSRRYILRIFSIWQIVKPKLV